MTPWARPDTEELEAAASTMEPVGQGSHAMSKLHHYGGPTPASCERHDENADSPGDPDE